MRAFRRSVRRRATVGLLVAAAPLAPVAAGVAGRALAVTVDDLPIAGSRHDDPAERERITRDLLAALGRRGIRAVGFVQWDRVRTADDERLLERWLDAGHELGNHSFSHPDFSRRATAEYLDDVERGRVGLARFLERHGRTARFFRFPYLREGDTLEKLGAAREYLARSGQRNLPPTIDTADWSFDARWTRVAARGDSAARRALAADYLASLRFSVVQHEETGDWLFDRPTPQILLLHANAVGAALWSELFEWLASTGHRFATVDEVLADPALAAEERWVGRYGVGFWKRVAAWRGELTAQREIGELLAEQAAAWNRGDLDAFCAVYAEDAAFLSPSGLTLGRAEILARYRSRYADRAAMGALALEIVETRLVHGTEVSVLGTAEAGSVHGASVAARWRLVYPDRPQAAGLTLLALRRVPAGWVIVQDASM